MQRTIRTSRTLVGRLALCLATALMLGLLPACGGGSSEICGTPARQVEGQEDQCAMEEDTEETVDQMGEIVQVDRRPAGDQTAMAARTTGTRV